MGRKNYRVFGFTLVELMIVLLIIAILAVIALVAFRSQLFKGNDAKRKSDLNRIGIAVEEYEKDHNCYPKVDDMKLCGTDQSIAIHPYLSIVPCDPITSAAYYYEPGPGSCPSWYRLYADLQYTADAAIVPGIGQDGAYNFYVGSANAPPLGAGSGATPGGGVNPGGSNLYACQGGHLVLITWDPSVCAQTFPSQAFESSCGTPENPQNNCYPP